MKYPWVDFSQLNIHKKSLPTILLDSQGNEIMRFQLYYKTPIQLHCLPKHIIQAFLAAEDRNFFHHKGIAFKGILRSIILNIYHNKKLQGASTITQQLIKLLFLDHEKTFYRKIQEQFLALITEYHFTKEQIIELYLNNIYFGCGIYGIEAASQKFWSKSAKDLSIGESALLAGIIKSPAHYCPLLDPYQALQRRNVILNCMHEMNYITSSMYQKSQREPLQLCQSNHTEKYAPHVKEYLRLILEKQLGKSALYTEGFIVQSTIDSIMQKKYFFIFKEHITTLRKEHKKIDGSLITIDVSTGAIRALIGGFDYHESNFNRAIQAKRQFGSIFKPIIYATAIEQGAQFYHTMIDQPIVLSSNSMVWSPKNAQKRFDGIMTLAYALIHSNNSIPLQLLLNIGIEKIVKKAKQCHISDPLYPYPSLALGCIDGTPYEAVAMFNIFANNGIYKEPYMIEWIKNRHGKKIWNHPQTENLVFTRTVNSQVVKALQAGRPFLEKAIDQTLPSSEIIGKSGTTNDAKTCWFIGSSPTYTTAVYVGNDDNTSLGKQVYGMKIALPLWVQCMNRIEHTINCFSYAPHLKEIIVHEKTGVITTSQQHDASYIRLFANPE